MAELRAKAIMSPVLVSIDGRPAHFTPEMIKQEMRLEYTEPVVCPACKKGTIVYRKSDEKYSIRKHRSVNFLGQNDYPKFIPIDADSTKRDEFGNYCDGVGGKVVPHICKPEPENLDDLFAVMKNMQEQFYEYAKTTDQWKRRTDEETLKKPAIVEYYDADGY